jgi:H+/Cl- antiporter ClcA
MDRRKLNAIVGYVSRSISAAALMIWGVFNMTALTMQYSRRAGDGGNWTASWIMCGLLGLLPFLLGSWLLYRNIAKANSGGERKSAD